MKLKASKYGSPVPGWPLYTVTSEGRVYRHGETGKPRELVQTPDRQGYPRVWLIGADRRKAFPVHRLVLLAHVGPPPKGHVAYHINDVKSDNRLENLRWDTQRLNIRLSVVTGAHHHTKLTPEAVREIRRLRAGEGLTHRKIAEVFSVDRSTVSNLLRGESWGWLE